MKPPKGPFWLWTDINTGLRWHLCVVTPGEDETPLIKFLTDEFEDYWYDDDWDESEIVTITPPEPLE